MQDVCQLRVRTKWTTHSRLPNKSMSEVPGQSGVDVGMEVGTGLGRGMEVAVEEVVMRVLVV